MSQSTHCAHLRDGQKMGDLGLVDTMIKDGLWDAFNGYHMGNTAENVAEKFQITREEQDAFALSSQRKAGDAQSAGRFDDEIVPVTIKSRRGETTVAADEYPRPETSIESLGKRAGTERCITGCARAHAAWSRLLSGCTINGCPLNVENDACRSSASPCRVHWPPE